MTIYHLVSEVIYPNLFGIRIEDMNNIAQHTLFQGGNHVDLWAIFGENKPLYQKYFALKQKNERELRQRGMKIGAKSEAIFEFEN